ncbi:MAG: hypothetical protein ACQSGP_29405 [Frankia sp.]
MPANVHSGEGKFQPDAFSVVRTQPFSVVGIQPDVFSVVGVQPDGPNANGPHAGAHEGREDQARGSGGVAYPGGEQDHPSGEWRIGGEPFPQTGGEPFPQTGGEPFPQTGGEPFPQTGGTPFLPNSSEPDRGGGKAPQATGYRANGASSPDGPSGYEGAAWQVGGGRPADSVSPGEYQPQARRVNTTRPDGWPATQFRPAHHQTDGWRASRAQPGGQSAAQWPGGNGYSGGPAADDGFPPDPWSADGPVQWATRRRAVHRRFGRGQAADQQSPDRWAVDQAPWADGQRSDPVARQIRAPRNQRRRGGFRLEKPDRMGSRRSRASWGRDNLASPGRRWRPLAAISSAVVAALAVVIVASMSRGNATTQVTPRMGAMVNTPGAAATAGTGTAGTNTAGTNNGGTSTTGAAMATPMTNTQAGAAMAPSGDGAATPILNISRRTVTGKKPTVNLTDLHASDWLHFGSLATPMQVEHAASGQGLPPTFATIGATAHVSRVNFVRYSWSDGAHTTRLTCSPTEIFVSGGGSGFRMVVPIPAKPATLLLYVGSVRSAAHLRIAADTGQVKDDIIPGNPGGSVHVVYTVMLRPAGNAKTVEITWTTPAGASGGSVIVESAALLPR